MVVKGLSDTLLQLLRLRSDNIGQDSLQPRFQELVLLLLESAVCGPFSRSQEIAMIALFHYICRRIDNLVPIQLIHAVCGIIIDGLKNGPIEKAFSIIHYVPSVLSLNLPDCELLIQPLLEFIQSQVTLLVSDLLV